MSLEITMFKRKEAPQSAKRPYAFHAVRRTDDNDDDDDDEDDGGSL